MSKSPTRAPASTVTGMGPRCGATHQAHASATLTCRVHPVPPVRPPQIPPVKLFVLAENEGQKNYCFNEVYLNTTVGTVLSGRIMVRYCTTLALKCGEGMADTRVSSVQAPDTHARPACSPLGMP